MAMASIRFAQNIILRSWQYKWYGNSNCFSLILSETTIHIVVSDSIENSTEFTSTPWFFFVCFFVIRR